jgi:two-component system CheB/CheR fusion protein
METATSFRNAVRDNASQKALEAHAREAISQRDRFLAILSHELRNPLSAILNAAQLLQLGTKPGQESEEIYRLVDRQAQQMARLLDDLLDASRITQGKIAIRKDVVDVAAVVEEAVQTVRQIIEARGHELIVDSADELLAVEGDHVRLCQVIENLVGNAAKYTPDGGRIVVSQRCEDGEVVLRVRDNGRGIPSDMLDSIFDLFVQSDTTLDRAEGGIGVGLTLARALTELHGGTIIARSEGPGRGSEFEVRLPLSNRTVDRPAEQPVETKTDSVRVLIVEDNADSRETLKLLLELDGFEVAAAETGSEGLAAVRLQRPDVALIDIGLPGLDGYQVAKEIRRDPENRQIRLVALTGYGRPEDRQRVLAAGFDAHLVKPIRVESLYPHLMRMDDSSLARSRPEA